MAEKVRVGVVGTGEWWGREHARLFSRRTDNVLVFFRAHLKKQPVREVVMSAQVQVPEDPYA